MGRLVNEVMGCFELSDYSMCVGGFPAGFLGCAIELRIEFVVNAG